MGLVARIIALAQAVAEDIKSLRQQVVDAGTLPVVTEDPAEQPPGRPWLRIGVSADFVPLGVRSGFMRSSVPADPSSTVAQLSVLTAEGVVLRFNASQVG